MSLIWWAYPRLMIIRLPLHLLKEKKKNREKTTNDEWYVFSVFLLLLFLLIDSSRYAWNSILWFFPFRDFFLRFDSKKKKIKIELMKSCSSRWFVEWTVDVEEPSEKKMVLFSSVSVDMQTGRRLGKCNPMTMIMSVVCDPILIQLGPPKKKKIFVFLFCFSFNQFGNCNINVIRNDVNWIPQRRQSESDMSENLNRHCCTVL